MTLRVVQLTNVAREEAHQGLNEIGIRDASGYTRHLKRNKIFKLLNLNHHTSSSGPFFAKRLFAQNVRNFVTSRIYYDNVDKKAVMVNCRQWRRTALGSRQQQLACMYIRDFGIAYITQCIAGIFNLDQKFHGLSCIWGLYIHETVQNQPRKTFVIRPPKFDIGNMTRKCH